MPHSYKKIKKLLLFILLTSCFTVIFYMSLLVTFGIVGVNTTYSLRHAKPNLQINPTLQTLIFEQVQKCVKEPSVMDYYHMAQKPFWFGHPLSMKEWNALTLDREGICTAKMLNESYRTSDFDKMMTLHDIFIFLHYHISSKDWP
jgi:hypothetical protein